MALQEQDRSQRLVLRAGRDATVDGEMRQERLDLRLAHLFRVNPLPDAIVVKPHEFLDPTPVRLDRARSQPPHLAGGFVSIEEFHASQCSAQELLGQFTR